MSLLWPEADAPRARHRLNQLLHLLRQDPMTTDAVAGGAQLHLNPAAMSSDVGDYLAAIAGRQWNTALAHYHGPFLDGFHLEDSPEFEEWQAGAGDAFRRKFRNALESAAHDAEARSGAAAAIEYWRRLAADDPLDERVAFETQRCQDRALAAPPRARVGNPDSLPLTPPPTDRTPDPQSPSSSRPGWRRRLLIPALALAALLAVVVYERRPGLDPNLVLIAIDNSSRDQHLDRLTQMATDYVAHGLIATGLVGVVTGRDDGKGNGDPRFEARASGAGKVLTVHLGRLRDSITIDARIVDAGSGRVLGVVLPVRADLDPSTTGLELLRQRVMAVFATLADPRFKNWVGATTPPRYDAYAEFLAGWEVFWRACDSCGGAGLAHLARAIALDSTYLVARTTTAMFQMLLGACDRTDSIAQALEPSRPRLAPVDLAQLEIAVAACRADWNAALNAARRGFRNAPRSPVLATTVPVLAVLANRPREALDVLDRAAALGGWYNEHPDGWWSRTQALHLLGRHRDELRVARQARRVLPGEWAVRVLEFESQAAAALGLEPEVVRLEQERLGRPVHLPRAATPGELMMKDGLEFLAHGRPAEAGRDLIRAAAWFGQAGRVDGAADVSLRLGETQYYLHHDSAAAANLEAALAAGRDSADVIGLLAAAQARLGDSTRADGARKWLLLHPGIEASLGLARLAMATGAPAQAIDHIRQALAAGLPFADRLHHDPDFLPLLAIPAYQELVRPKG